MDSWDLLGLAAILLLSIVVGRRMLLNWLLRRISRRRDELRNVVELSFMVEPCFRCQEFAMRLIDVSPNGRSVHYKCLHCEKKKHSPAGTPDAARAVGLWNDLVKLVNHHNQFTDRR